LNWRG